MNPINQLITYAISKKLINERDIIYSINQIIYLLNIDTGFKFEFTELNNDIDSILDDVANLKGNFNTLTEKELFKSKLINTLLDKPSLIESKFYEKYSTSPKSATDYFYKLSQDVNYIKNKQIAKNIVYKYKSNYGLLDITINMSKPEKSLEEIKLLSETKSIDWPKCLLCVEHEGYFGNLKSPDRSNHRIITLNLNDEKWFLQYSPYSYFNEHSIVLKENHIPMKISKQTFINLIDFVDKFPHYMIGSNADLPIVGGSMLSHDHYQAGCYNFPIFDADIEHSIMENDVEISIVKWPISTIKLTSNNKESIIDMANNILNKWRKYNNEDLNILHKTDEPHNTITPIVKKVEDNFEIYLLLRNNRTTKEHPDGLFHPHKDKHFIKRENIGLIEAIGLAVLPPRLNDNINTLENIIINKKPLPSELIDFKDIYNKIINNDVNNINDLIKNEIGAIFEKILEDCSVFKGDINTMKNFIGDK